MTSHKIQKLDKTNLDFVRAKINEKLAPLAIELGLTKCRVGNITFAVDGGTFAVEIQIDQNFSPEVRAYNDRTSRIFGFPVNIVDRTFSFKGQTFKITGFNIASRKFPIEVISLSEINKSSAFSAASVTQLLQLEQAQK